MLLQFELTLLVCTLCLVMVQNSETTDEEETLIRLSVPVEPVEDGMLSIHCQIWNLDPGHTVIISRLMDDEIESLSFNTLVPDTLDRVFLAVRQMPDSSVVYFLTIIEVTSADAGNYSCKVISTSGKTADVAVDSAEVIVSYFPPENSLSCSTPTPLIAGKRASFNCSSIVTGYPHVSLQWTQAGTSTMLKSESTSRPSDVYNQLHFTPSMEDNGVILLCVMMSPKFPDARQSCHIGPLKVRAGPEESDSVVTHKFDDDVTIRTSEEDNYVDTVKPIPERCSHICEISTNSRLFYWIIATSVAGAMALIFLLLVLVLFLRLLTHRKPNTTIRKFPVEGLYPEDIYVDLERRRGGEKVYMALEKRDHIDDI